MGLFGSIFKGIGKAGLGIAEGITSSIGEGAIGASEAAGKTFLNHAFSMPEKLLIGAASGAAIGGILADADGQASPAHAMGTGLAVGLGAAAIPGAMNVLPTIGVSALGAGVMAVKGTEMFGRAMVKAPAKDIKVNLSNVGEYKLRGIAIPVLMGSALLSGVSEGLKTFEKSRMGTNDGMMRTLTPNINIQNDVYNAVGANMDATPSFARNAGATGDLVFAMYNGTH